MFFDCFNNFILLFINSLPIHIGLVIFWTTLRCSWFCTFDLILNGWCLNSQAYKTGFMLLMNKPFLVNIHWFYWNMLIGRETMIILIVMNSFLISNVSLFISLLGLAMYLRLWSIVFYIIILIKKEAKLVVNVPTNNVM